MFEVLTAAEMAKADASAIAGGVPGIRLMNAAGAAVAHRIVEEFKTCPVLVLCGPGNNGGDGFIIAQHLKKAGWTVRVACLVKRTALKGDAALAAKDWEGEIETLNSSLSVHQTGLVVDAIFGTGFDRALDLELVILFEKIRTRKIPVVAVDVPTGLNATTGAADPETLKAALTVTFCRKKIGHLLLPGKIHCGRIVVADIGITDAVVAALNTSCFENHPALWLKSFPLPDAESHKYGRGHAMIYGGEKRTGAACLAAAAAQKIGAGLVTITSPAKTVPVYSAFRASIMVDACEGIGDMKTLLRDERKNAVLIGPGAGVDRKLRQIVETALSFNKSGVLDADVFSVYRDNPKDLFSKLSPKYVLTPHEGEFKRFFGIMNGDKLERALKAAKTANAIVLLKGSDTIIAAPDGASVINANAPPTLATAGSGDVLSGLITGLIAQGMPPFMAACAAVWLHGKAAQAYGPGLTAEDIIFTLPQALNGIFSAV
ncbi:MAG: NAD(P)H-hydrate dehydratase [Pseudomonadota bacterium]